ncbi:GntR family transcriptional regulator [Paenibacillus sacheonensis]|uniref:Substrate-binding domain-containing protein n=1 Tax=Paenibacillus sacheonensis TaxID=742054 RepID=A0A7X5BZM5_9BACL|nr:GntR family transcriptional regulator [Paenibacillus sacheonensis]MBM7566687.1 GntR family transcriptional regulator of arabinose operon [Paenibacillus sacheonensis]NBC70666.1 substrate-binding domain-containing protein [Paenibacillus sacheonensis]
MSTDREPLYIRIQNHFKDAIRAGRLRTDDKIPTEKELLEQFDVSRITVANALGELAREGWIRRIPGRGTYVQGVPEDDGGFAAEDASEPERLQAQEGKGARPRIGVVIPFIGDYFAIRLLAGLRAAVEGAGCSLIVMFTFNDKERETELIRELRDTMDGMVVFPVDAAVYNEEIIGLKMSGYPFVLIDRYLPGVETNTVLADGALAAKLAVDHLWALGHRRIAICADTPVATVSVDERINGYMSALKAKGALIDPMLLLTDFNVHGVGRGGGNPLAQAIASRAATAYIALNSTLGLHIAALAKAADLEVPRDLSIVAFDNPSGGLLKERGAFTYLDQNEGEMGRRAGELLLESLRRKGRGASSYKRIVLEPELVVRETTAKAPPSE